MSTIRYTVGGNYDVNSSEDAVYDRAVVDGPQTRYEVYVSDTDTTVYIDEFSDAVVLRQGGSMLAGASNGVFLDFSDHSSQGYLEGGSFGDLIRTGSGNDDLNGGAGNDTLEGGLGSNTINGDTGINTVSYEHYQEDLPGYGVYVRLDQGFGVSLFSGRINDQLSNVQNIHGSAFFDQLFGNGLDNLIEGGGGPDALYGLGGNDRLILKGGSGAAAADGGDDYDILILESGAGPYTFVPSQIFNIEQVNVRDGVSADFSQLTSTPGLFRSVSLTGGGVSLTTAGQADKIRAGLGNDTISAGSGDDTILVLDGGSATIDGGAGTDRLLVQSGSHAFTDATLMNMEFLVVRSGASLDLGAMTASTGKITSTSVAGDGVTIIGTAGAEWIRLGAGGDEVTGGAGNDTLAGGAGDDTFHYEAAGFGRDQLFADLATDHVDLAGLATSVDDLSFRTSFDGNDVLVSIRGLPDTDVIVLNDVTLADVQAANGFFLF
jgi:Ca2+-binding RTX toxin-like protein